MNSGCAKKQPDHPPAPPDVVVAEVVQQDVPIYEEWVGTLSGEVNATIQAQVSGYITTRAYREGSFVRKDDVLFQIDPAPFEASLAKAKAQLLEARAHKGKTALDVERYTPLAATDAISKQELDDAVQADKAADGEVASAQAAVQEAELNLGFTTIQSPVDGVAGLAQAQIGDLVGPTFGALTTVAQVDPIRVYFAVSQKLVFEVWERMLAEGKEIRTGEGPELEILLATGGYYSLKGRIRFADNQVDVRTGTVRVVGEFPNPQRLLTPGMFTRVRALMGTNKNALLVPQRAVTEIQGRFLISVVGADNMVTVRQVQVGERMGELWVIEGDIRAGDRVVAEGVQKARDGEKVSPKVSDASASTRPATAPAKEHS